MSEPFDQGPPETFDDLGKPEEVHVVTLREAALWALEYFEARDRSNAKIHCAPVRYSPITERLAMALRETWPIAEDITEEMAHVLHNTGDGRWSG